MATWPAKTNYATGDVLTAAQMNDIGGELNDLYTASGFAAGKNKIINGSFDWNQRAFSSTTTSGTYGFDRFYLQTTDGTSTYSAQTFTAGAAPVAGYEATNYARLVSTGQTLATAQTTLRQKIESVRTFAGQTIALSFWAKASTGTPAIAAELVQDFGSGGSASVTGIISSKQTISSSWARYTFTATVPSISGKTIGTSDNLQVLIWTSAGTDFNSRTGSLGIQSVTIDIWGVQMEAGSTATPFQTATGTKQGELAACQRYFQILGGDDAFEYFAIGSNISTTASIGVVSLKQTMRTAPTLTFTTASNFRVTEGVTANTASAVATNIATKNTVSLEFTTTGLTLGRASRMLANNTTSATIQFSSEL